MIPSERGRACAPPVSPAPQSLSRLREGFSVLNFMSCQKAGECRQWLVGVGVYSNQLCNCNHQQGLGRVTALQSTADLRRAQVKVAPSQALSFSAGGPTTVSSF